MLKKVILSAGGTGGHLFPAQSVAKQLSKHAEILFVAGGLKTNPFFDRNAFSYKEIPAASFNFSNPLNVLKRGMTICRGIKEARQTMRAFDPDLVVGFGSFHSLGMLTAAAMSRVPILLHEQNVLPGRVNRLFSRFAQGTAITFPKAADYLKGKTKLVSFPQREREKLDPWKYFGWEAGKKTLLVCGGSQGAKRLNQIAPHLIGHQVLHVVGSNGDPEVTQRHYSHHGIHALVKKFEPRLDLAMQIVDLAICRAGASTICELITHATPAILIPFPYAKDDHQWHNADFFTRQIGGGITIREESLDDKALILAISELDRIKCRKNLNTYREKQVTDSFESFILDHL